MGNQSVDEQLVAHYVRRAIDYFKSTFDLDCTLSEIFSLRRYVIESIEAQHGAKRDISDSAFDAAHKFLWEYYGIDWADLYPRSQKGFIQLGVYSKLVSDPSKLFGDESLIFGSEIDPQFKEYLRRVHSRMYTPEL